MFQSSTANDYRSWSSEQILQAKPRYAAPSYRFLKRTFDVLGSASLLLLLFPVFLIVTIVVALNDGFPVIFKQRRLGEGGKEFWMYKFRSMRKDAEEILRSRPDLMKEYQETFKIQNDPRLLKAGKFLRKSSLDELPQLVNVLKGEMSLVGPRPIVAKEIEKYGAHQSVYLAMKPGCAGLWQCSGRSELTYDERIEKDIEYYMHASFRRDFLVLWRTAVSVIKREGAY